MRRLFQRIACVAVLGVMSGAPAVAVICAELCAPAAHHDQAEATPCHGQHEDGPAMTGEPTPDCGDHGAAIVTAIASLTTSRVHDLAVPDSAVLIVGAVPASSSGPSHAWHSSSDRTPTPLRPTRSRAVLRI